MSTETASKPKMSKLNIVAIVVSVILILLIIPMLTVTIVLTVKSTTNPDYPPSIFGYAPLTVASGSMSGSNKDSFDEGDLIFIKVLDEDGINNLQVNDVICFYTDGMFVTHRIVSVTTSESTGAVTSVVTMGDANYTQDGDIEASSIYGIYAGKIPNLGSFAEFLQTPGGIAVFVAIPVAAFIVYDILKFISLKKNKSALEIQSKDEEIARLKQMIDEQNAAGTEGPDGGEGNQNG